MLTVIFGDMTVIQIAAIILSAVLIGINKTGIPGIGLIPVIILTLLVEPKAATGMQLTMLCTADIMAVIWYRRCCKWHLVLKMLPAAVAGLATGEMIVRSLDSNSMILAIGIIILILTAISTAREIWWNDAKIPSHWTFTVLAGLLAGTTTQIANAAGPVMALYLLAIRLPKEEYVGTAAWYFMIMNYIKLPIFVWGGRVTLQAFYIDLAMIPFLLIGAALGILALQKMPKKLFNRIILILSALAAIYMVIRSTPRLINHNKQETQILK